MKEYTGMMDSIVTSAVRSLVFTMIGYALSQSLEFLIMALGFWYGSRLIASGEYTVTQFFVIFIAVVFGGQAAAQFFGYSTSITKAKVAANYILWLRTLQGTVREDNHNAKNGPSGDGAIGLENVEFRYKQRNASRVLKGITMKVRIPTKPTPQAQLTPLSRSNPAPTSPASAPRAAAKPPSSPSSNASTIPSPAASPSTTTTSPPCLPNSTASTCRSCSRNLRSTPGLSARTSLWDYSMSPPTRKC